MFNKKRIEELEERVGRLERQVTNMREELYFNFNLSAMLWGPAKLSVKNVVQSLVEDLGYELISYPEHSKVEYIRKKRVHKKKNRKE